MKEAVIVSIARTPVGKVRGALAGIPSYKLGGLAIKETLAKTGLAGEEVDEVIFGNLMNNDINNMARVALLEAGLPHSVPGVTLDRQCASALNAIAYASVLIQTGNGEVMIAGGVESDSNQPYFMEKPKAAYQMTPPKWATIHTAPGELNVPMGITAENLAVRYGLTREECDQFAAASHQKAAAAWEKGYFDDQVITIEAPFGKTTQTVRRDETMRPDTTAAGLAKLRPSFKPDGIVTAGNSSPLCDGAAAVVIMSGEKAAQLGLKPLARFKGFATAGVDPHHMGIGPVAATRKLLKQQGLSLSDIDLIELNEAFAAQSLACIKELDLDPDKVNVNGGAIALGHPMGGTGAILAGKLVSELARRELNLGLITFCIGGGQGMSLLLERMG